MRLYKKPLAMVPRRITHVLVVNILMRALVKCQIAKDFMSMATRPANSSEIFKATAQNASQCIYICVPNIMCHALLYSGSTYECFGYRGHVTYGDALDGAVAMRTVGKSVD